MDTERAIVIRTNIVKGEIQRSLRKKVAVDKGTHHSQEDQDTLLSNDAHLNTLLEKLSTLKSHHQSSKSHSTSLILTSTPTGYLSLPPSRNISLLHITRRINPPLPSTLLPLTLRVRLTHTVTTNAHLCCPVYCCAHLPKGRGTGDYFVTAADDHLAKVWYRGKGGRLALPGNTVLGSSGTTSEFSVKGRGFEGGAVLVATLRGHNDVITDVSYNHDCSLISTASLDGDVRIWGARGGNPIAVLRGHGKGCIRARFVEGEIWRVVSAGMDGVVRGWSFKDAVERRGGGGCREEFKETWEEDEEEEEGGVRMNEGEGNDRQEQEQEEEKEEEEGENHESQEVELPPLPPPPGAGGGGGANEVEGVFRANDQLDDGVNVLWTFKDAGAGYDVRGRGRGRGGDNNNNNNNNNGIEELCMCPLGGSFAVFGEDGVIRVFEMGDDPALKRHDMARFMDDTVPGLDQGANPGTTNSPKRKGRRCGTNLKLLGSLRGHETLQGPQNQQRQLFDLAYSNKGDRMLSSGGAECKVNIWSWGYREAQGGGTEPDFENVARVVIWVLDPYTKAANTAGGRSHKYKTEVNCVAWTCDDSRIITAQSTGLRKDLDREDGAGRNQADRFNQFVRVWDSFTGDMLACVHAHTDKVAKILPHPKAKGVFLTAGLDGHLFVWDTGIGREDNPVFEHKNSFKHGMVNNVPGERYKEHGEDVVVQYSEGDWSEDGRGVVVGDHAGRFTVIDCFQERDVKKRQSEARDKKAREGTLTSEISSTRIDDVAGYDAPKWMKEQYFSTDYNDLSYDHSGYAVDTASGMPPHVAPRGGRTNHLMLVEQDGVEQDVEERFKNLKGPRWKLDEDAGRERMETRRMRR